VGTVSEPLPPEEREGDEDEDAEWSRELEAPVTDYVRDYEAEEATPATTGLPEPPAAALSNCFRTQPLKSPSHPRAARGGDRRRPLLLAHGPDPVDHRARDRGADPPRRHDARGQTPRVGERLYERMRRKLSTEHRRKLYAQRKISLEPVYGQTKHNRRIGRFMRRG
jgi:Transposase DDE domain